jgi:hypothetical protein
VEAAVAVDPTRYSGRRRAVTALAAGIYSSPRRARGVELGPGGPGGRRMGSDGGEYVVNGGVG